MSDFEKQVLEKLEQHSTLFDDLKKNDTILFKKMDRIEQRWNRDPETGKMSVEDKIDILEKEIEDEKKNQ